MITKWRYLQSLAVRLRPNETGVDKLDFREAFYALYAERKQLLALQLGGNPMLRRLQVAVALLAPQDSTCLLNPRGNVHLNGSKALNIRGGGI